MKSIRSHSHPAPPRRCARTRTALFGQVCWLLLGLSLASCALPGLTDKKSSEEKEQQQTERRILDRMQRKSWTDYSETGAVPSDLPDSENPFEEEAEALATATPNDDASLDPTGDLEWGGDFDAEAEPAEDEPLVAPPSDLEEEASSASESPVESDALVDHAEPWSDDDVVTEDDTLVETVETPAPSLTDTLNQVAATREEVPSHDEAMTEPEVTEDADDFVLTSVRVDGSEDAEPVVEAPAETTVDDPVPTEPTLVESSETAPVVDPAVDAVPVPAAEPDDEAKDSATLETPQVEVVVTGSQAPAMGEAPVVEEQPLETEAPKATWAERARPTIARLASAFGAGPRDEDENEAAPPQEADPIDEGTAEGEPVAQVAAYEPTFQPATGGPTDAEAEMTDVPDLSLELRDVALKDLVRAIAQREGFNVIVPETLTETVSISLEGIDPRAALESILAANGYHLIDDGTMFRVEAVPEQAKLMSSRTFTLTSVPIEMVQESLAAIVSAEGKLIMNEDSPSFVMIDYPANIGAMEDYLRLIDRREKQVLIEVQILEVILNEQDAIGTALQILDISIDDVTGAYVHNLVPQDALAAIAIASNKSPIQAMIEALSIRRNLNILSTPKLITMNGREAFIEVLASIPYIDSTATTSQSTEGGGSTVIEQVQFKESGIKLVVTPVISNDGYVKLKITPEVRELVDFFNGIPVIDSRKIDTNVLVKNGNTVILGGLLREEELDEVQKTPLLGDIPLVGALFRRTEKNIKKSELLVFITPYIVDAENEGELTREANDRLDRFRREQEERRR